MSDPERWEHPIPGSDWRIVVEKHEFGERLRRPLDFDANWIDMVYGNSADAPCEFWIAVRHKGPVPF